MTEAGIRESAATAVLKAWQGTGVCGLAVCSYGPCQCALDAADAALSALPISTETLADLAAGRAVVVPAEATHKMQRAPQDRDDAREIAGEESMYAGIYRAMLAASPYAAKPVGEANNG